MKKILSATALTLALLPAGQALADQDVGCGLGTMLFAGQSGLAPKVVAATTNGTSGNQTFGITFGTLGCQADGTITSREKLNVFINHNLDNLARDIAKGQGETLATLAEVWGIAAQDQAAFNAAAQQNFAKIFQGNEVTSEQVISNLNEVVAANQALSAYTLS